MGRPALSSDLDEIERVMRKRNIASSNRFLDALHRHHGLLPEGLPVDEIVEAPSDKTQPANPMSVKEWVDRQKKIHEPWFAIVEEIAPAAPRPILIEDIQRAVCKFYGVGRIDFLSARRTADVVGARHVAMYLCKTLTLKSLLEIGRRLGNRDHTTVLHGVRKMTALVQTHEATLHAVTQIKLDLGVA